MVLCTTLLHLNGNFTLSFPKDEKMWGGGTSLVIFIVLYVTLYCVSKLYRLEVENTD